MDPFTCENFNSEAAAYVRPVANITLMKVNETSDQGECTQNGYKIINELLKTLACV